MPHLPPPPFSPLQPDVLPAQVSQKLKAIHGGAWRPWVSAVQRACGRVSECVCLCVPV